MSDADEDLQSHEKMGGCSIFVLGIFFIIVACCLLLFLGETVGPIILLPIIILVLLGLFLLIYPFVRFLFFQDKDSPIAGVVAAAIEAAVIKKVVKVSRKKK